MGMTLKSTAASLLALPLLVAVPACAQSVAQSPSASTAMAHPNSIQPETTLNISATGQVERAPDLAILTGGVTTDAKTAQEALAANREAMVALFGVLEEAGIEDKDIQTSNFSLNARYNYPRNESPVLVGYTASNMVTVRVHDLANVGPIIDAMVAEGGNTFNGVQFALEDPSEAQDEARRKAMEAALARAELYANAAGLKIKRIVTMSESGGYMPQPMPMMAMRAMDMAESAPTPIAGGEVGYSATVNIQFELEQ